MTVNSLLQNFGLVKLWHDICRNRRLQIGLALVLAILAVEGVLSWTDALSEQEKALAKLRDQKRHLRSQIQDKTLLQETLQRAESIQAAARTRIWVVPSEAVGQARQKDWLQTMFREMKIPLQSLVLAAPRKREKTPAEKEPFMANKTADIREFRATVSIPFSPHNLERVLAAVEGGEFLTRIEALSASRRQRRIGLELVMLMEINPSSSSYPVPEADLITDDPGLSNPKALEIEAAVKTVIERENVARSTRS